MRVDYFHCSFYSTYCSCLYSILNYLIFFVCMSFKKIIIIIIIFTICYHSAKYTTPSIAHISIIHVRVDYFHNSLNTSFYSYFHFVLSC